MTKAFDYESKIAGLLRKAEDGATSPAEAEALSAMAEKLMLKYGIDRATAAAARKGATPEEMTSKVFIKFTGEYRDAWAYLSHAVAMGLKVDGFQSAGNFNQTRKTGRSYIFVGFTGDCEAAKVLVESLQIQCLTALNVWAKSGGIAEWMSATDKRRARVSFIEGFGNGARARIERAAAAVEKEAESTAPGTGLVLASKADRRDAYMATLGLKTTKRRAARDWSASGAGRAAGLNSNTGGSAVGGGAKAIGR